MNEAIKEECICAEWDEQGWSVCGVPCSLHWKSENGETINEAYQENQRQIKAFMEKVRAERRLSK